MMDLYFEDPIKNVIEREINSSKVKYFYFNKDFEITTKQNEVLCGCLLSGNAKIVYNQKSCDFNQFDFIFLPPDVNTNIKIPLKSKRKMKICYFSYDIKTDGKPKFEIQKYNTNKFLPRGEGSSDKIMATFRTVWTAIKNGYFMSGFTNIPNESLKQGVITSVNLEDRINGRKEIYSHIHPEYPEVYIMCIDDNFYAITQYLINSKGESVCKDLQDGEGLFFPGLLGHSNFTRPIYKKLNYCMYMWIIPTYGRTEKVSPITLKV
jgi:hypothetical protein